MLQSNGNNILKWLDNDQIRLGALPDVQILPRWKPQLSYMSATGLKIV